MSINKKIGKATKKTNDLLAKRNYVLSVIRCAMDEELWYAIKGETEKLIKIDQKYKKACNKLEKLERKSVGKK